MLVTDLKSTNGTFIEEEEIEAMVPNDLPLGSEVIFGEPCSRIAVYLRLHAVPLRTNDRLAMA